MAAGLSNIKDWQPTEVSVNKVRTSLSDDLNETARQIENIESNLEGLFKYLEPILQNLDIEEGIDSKGLDRVRQSLVVERVRDFNSRLRDISDTLEALPGYIQL